MKIVIYTSLYVLILSSFKINASEIKTVQKNNTYYNKALKVVRKKLNTYAKLTVIGDENHSLVRGDHPEQILMAVILSDQDAYENFIPLLNKTFEADEMWASVYPELRKKCQNLYSGQPSPDRALRVRVKQMMGLPDLPKNYNYVLNFWVNKGDLFRPCTNPKIDVVDCKALDKKNMKGSKSHQEWLVKYTEGLRKTFPFTGMGYSYNWRYLEDKKWKKNNNYIGLTEFVVKEGAKIVPHSLEAIEQYCD